MCDTFTQKICAMIRNDCLGYLNVQFILDRLRVDKTFDQLSNLFEKTIDQEIIFATAGSFNRTLKTEKR